MTKLSYEYNQGMKYMETLYREGMTGVSAEQLYRLFCQEGWASGEEDGFKRTHFNAPFAHSTYVVTAWQGDTIVGCARVVGDTIVRSVLCDVLVDKKCRGQGIGSHMVQMCLDKYPKSQWLVMSASGREPFYKRMGFEKNTEGTCLVRASQWF